MSNLFVTFAFGLPGVGELWIIAIIVLLLFGTRIPAVMRSMGQGVNEFKKGIKEGAESSDAPGAARETTVTK